MTAFEVFANPETGQQISVQSIDAEALVVESLMPAGSPKPPPHYHPSQHEFFEVLEGEVETEIGGQARVYAAGERFEIPPGTVHEMSNTADAPARVRWETRPALNTLGFFRLLGRVWGGDHAAGAELPSFSAEIRFDVDNAA